MQKTILVPTDFSENAYLAAVFACQLAVEKKYQIHLYHYYTFASANFGDESENQDLAHAHVLKADVAIIEIKEKLASAFPSLLINSTCDRGLLQEKLPLIANEKGYALIVMGTTGSSEAKNVNYGSNTSAITAKSPIPVIAIPFQHSDYLVNKVGLLTNFKAEEIETLIEYISLVNTIDELYLIHVYKEVENASEVKERLEAWTHNIKEIEGVQQVIPLYDHLSKDVEEFDSVSEVVNQFVDKNDIDFLLVTKTRKSFFNRIFKPSVSKEIALDLKVPAFFDKIS